MEIYDDPNFWAKLLGMFTFYDIVMGCGSIYEDENGEVRVSFPSSDKLDCGCRSMAHFTLDKITNKLVSVDHKSDNFVPKKSISNRFHSTMSTNFWDDFYEKYPYKKPVRIVYV
jgi:hypothetical protein